MSSTDVLSAATNRLSISEDGSEGDITQTLASLCKTAMQLLSEAAATRAGVSKAMKTRIKNFVQLCNEAVGDYLIEAEHATEPKTVGLAFSSAKPQDIIDMGYTARDLRMVDIPETELLKPSDAFHKHLDTVQRFIIFNNEAACRFLINEFLLEALNHRAQVHQSLKGTLASTHFVLVEHTLAYTLAKPHNNVVYSTGGRVDYLAGVAHDDDLPLLEANRPEFWEDVVDGSFCLIEAKRLGRVQDDESIAEAVAQAINAQSRETLSGGRRVRFIVTDGSNWIFGYLEDDERAKGHGYYYITAPLQYKLDEKVREQRERSRQEVLSYLTYFLAFDELDSAYFRYPAEKK